MAIDLATSPNLVTTSGTSVNTSSFTRPEEGLLVALVGAFSEDRPTVSGGGLTWTRRIERVAYESDRAEIWTAPVTGSGSMTVTLGGLVDTGVGRAGAIKVWAVTGADTDAPVGQTGQGSSASNTLTANAYTSSVKGSRGFFCAVESEGLGSPTAQGGDLGDGFNFSLGDFDVSGIGVVKAANTASEGTPVSFQVDAPGNSAAEWLWGAIEILPGGEDAEIDLEEIPVTVTMPDPAISISGDRTPGPAAPTVTMPDTAVSAGAGAHPPSITTTVTMPAVTAVTGTTETAVPATAEPAVDMPDVAATVAVSTIPAVAGTTVDMPDVDLSVSAHIHLGSIDVTVSMPRPFVSVPVLPGDAITRPGQIEWNGFLLGSGTPYAWLDLVGYNDSPPWISGNVDRPDSSGSYPGQPYAAERVLNWSMLTRAQRGQMGQVIRDLIMATGLSQTEDELPLVVWDFDAAEPRLLYAHLSNRAPGPVDRQARLGLMRGALQWTASDPRLYSVIRHSATIEIDTERDLLNDGNEATPVELRIPGPATVPQIENMSLDRVFAFNLTIDEGETLVIDTQHGTAAIGASNRGNTLIQGSVSVQDFVLGPGINRLAWTAESGGTVMEALWRHAHT